MARLRAVILFDQSARWHALPLGTGNKSERLLGYFTWHADDSPPINPLGDLFETQVWALARHLGVPDALANPVLQLFSGQTVLATNDDWQTQDAGDASAIQASGFAPLDPSESAIMATLAPGGYTAIVSGVGGTTGVAIVEVFKVTCTQNCAGTQ